MQPDFKFIRVNELCERLGGISRTTLWRWERRGLIPRKRQLGPNTVGWLESEIEAWFTATAAQPHRGLEPDTGSGES